MKLREVMNRVLRATGQTQIECSTTLIEDDNQLLVLEFLNQFKEEIEAHNFRQLKQTWTTTVSANAGFGIVGSPSGSVTGRARMARVHDARFGKLIPLAYDITDANQPQQLDEWDLALIYNRLQTASPAGSSNALTAFSLDVSSSQKLLIRTYPLTNVDRTVKTTLYVPQDYLDVDDLDTEIWIPTRSLLIGTIWAVLEERGEELGQSSMWTEERYRTALDGEVAADMADAGEPELVPV